MGNRSATTGVNPLSILRSVVGGLVMDRLRDTVLGGQGGATSTPSASPSGAFLDQVSYPTPPTPYAGTSLLSQHLDPTTTYLYNQPPPMAAAPTTTTTTLPSQPAPQGQVERAAAAETLLQGYPNVAELRANIRDNYQHLRRLLRDPHATESPFARSLVSSLINQGAITLTPTDFDMGDLPRVRGKQSVARLIDLVDQVRAAGQPISPREIDALRLLGVIPPREVTSRRK